MTEVSGPVISTPRLVLRPWREQDLAALAAINADSRVMRYMPKPLSVEETQAAFKTLLDHFHRHGFGVWAVEVRGIPEVVGGVGICHPPYQAHFTPCVELSWRIAHQYQGRGYATEAARAALKFGFSQLKLDEIVSMTVPANEQSWLLMERLGMKRNPQDDFNHPRLALDHPLSRHVLYRISRADWEESNRELTAGSRRHFGRRLDGRSYLVRPGSYAIISDSAGRVCVVEGVRGNGLPGGGAENGETPEQTLHREVREECGRDVVVERELGFAVEFVHSSVEGNFEKRCTFYEAHLADDGKPGVAEEGSRLLWLSPMDAIAMLTHETHRWAVARAVLH